MIVKVKVTPETSVLPMPPSPKFNAVRRAVAHGLLGPTTRNKVVTCSQFTDAFNTRVGLGDGMGLTDAILKRSYTAIGEDNIYCILCKEMGIEYTGEFVYFLC